MQNYIINLNTDTKILMVLSLMLLAGFVMTRFTNTLNLPKVSGYILAGVIIGPYMLNLVPTEITQNMGFVSDLALSFIAFGVGKFFKKEVLLQTGKKVVLITIFEALSAGVLVTIATYFLFHTSLIFALLLGAIATATAPASTMMTINQYKAEGDFIDTLLQVVALDDVVCLLAFSVVSAIASSSKVQGVTLSSIIGPIGYNMITIGLGLFCGYFLSQLLIPTRSKDNRLILVIALLCGLSGICAVLNISPLLSCMVFGASYINFTEDKKLFQQINSFTPPIMSMFFVLSGINLNILSLKTVGIIGVAYFLIRIIGKYCGTFIGAKILRMDDNIKKYLGLALIPQAGVSIGLAYLGQRLLPKDMGDMLLTIILSSAVLYEMVGPVSAKIALIYSGCISTNNTENTNDTSIASTQVENIQQIEPLPEISTSTDNTEILQEENAEPEQDVEIDEIDDVVENIEVRVKKKKKKKKKKTK